jgi:flagellar basal-body rod protein FlgB
MTAYSWRLRGLTANIANLDTPGYRRMEVTFEDALQRAKRGGRTEVNEVTARMKSEDRPPQLEDELMDLADTQMRTQLAARALHEHFARLRTGITGRPG